MELEITPFLTQMSVNFTALICLSLNPKAGQFGPRIIHENTTETHLNPYVKKTQNTNAFPDIMR